MKAINFDKEKECKHEFVKRFSEVLSRDADYCVLCRCFIY